jgi:hypothetical protein
MRSRTQRPWPTYLLAALCVGAIVAAVLVVGPSSGTASSTGRTITVGEGVVQATVSGSGNIQAATQLDLGFKTSGVVTQIYVHQGQHVTEGQLLAELNPDSAEVTLEQARASLQAAEASLVQEEETDGEGSSGSSSSGTGSSHATASTTSLTSPPPPRRRRAPHQPKSPPNRPTPRPPPLTSPNVPPTTKNRARPPDPKKAPPPHPKPRSAPRCAKPTSPPPVPP